MKLAHILTGLLQPHNDMMNTRVFLLKFYTNERWYHCHSRAKNRNVSEWFINSQTQHRHSFF